MAASSQLNRTKVCLHDARICYTVSILLGLPYEKFTWPDWLLYEQSASNQAKLIIIPSSFFGQEYGSEKSLPTLPLKKIAEIPILFGETSVKLHNGTLIVHADIVASAYFLLTRYEEWVRPEVRDEHGRFPGKESLPFRAGFIDRPVVDEYAELLKRWAGQVGIEIPKPARRFSILLTHDVDTIGPPPGPLQAVRRLTSGILRRTPMLQALQNTAAACGIGHHPIDNLDEVIRIDQRITKRFEPDRCRSIFFFMAGGNTPFDGAYKLRSSRMLRRLQQVLHSGAEIGLHASYQAGENPDCIRLERQALQEVSGLPIEKNRHHFLRWREPAHGQMIAEAGIHWDTTLGYADIAGFRLGVCRPIQLFDPIQQCVLGIEEHPLIVMDCSLNREGYMNLGEEAAFDSVCQLANATLRHQGEFVILWHNTELSFDNASYHRRLYPRVLDYLLDLLKSA